MNFKFNKTLIFGIGKIKKIENKSNDGISSEHSTKEKEVGQKITGPKTI